MKSFLSSSTICVFVLFLSPLSLFAAPKIMVPSATHEFGAVPQGEIVKHVFTIKNGGTEVLEVQRVVPACGCTVSSLEKNSLAPGEETNLSVDFDTRGMSGSKVKTVRVYTNDPQKLTSLLTLKGEVLPELIVEPARVHFGEVLRSEESGQFIERSVKIQVRKDSKAKIKELLSRSGSIEINSQIAADERSATARIRLKKDASLGEFRDRVIIKVSGSSQSTVNLPLYASLKAPISVKPQSIAFGIVQGEGLITREVLIQNKGKESFAVVAARSESPTVKVAVSEKEPGKSVLLKAQLQKELVEKDLKTAIRLTVKRGDREEEEILVAVTAVLPPEFLKKRGSTGGATAR